MLDGPSARTCSFLKKALAPNTEPVRRWHSPQWQTPTTSGSADTSTRKAPQQQCAVLVIVPLRHQPGRDYSRAAIKAIETGSVDPPIVNAVDDQAGDAVLDNLGHRATPKGDHRRPVGHRLDKRKAEWLRPIDRKQQRRRIAQECTFFAIADLADKVDPRILE